MTPEDERFLLRAIELAANARAAATRRSGRCLWTQALGC